MTKLLGKGFKEASRLPVVDQNALAKWLLDELEAEKKWELKFAESEDVLDKLADEALKDHKKGKTRPLNIERLYYPNSAIRPGCVRQTSSADQQLL